MKIIQIKSVLVFTLLILTKMVQAQGCSDAGVCTMNSFKPIVGSTNAKNQFKIGLSTGGADNSISTIGNYLEYNRRFGQNLSIDARLTSLSQNGNSVSEFGLSDIFANINYLVNENFQLTVGAKIPLANGNKLKNNLALPMDYQSSLGTTDLIIGLSYQIKNLQLVGAIQQPLSQNDNQFFASKYPSDSKLNLFQSTNKFVRSADVLLRISYPLSFGNKLKITPSILPIYHLANDKYTDESNIEKEIDGSQGLTLNGNVYLDYMLNEKSALQLSVGMPLAVRKSRPDGLTRSYVLGVEYNIKF